MCEILIESTISERISTEIKTLISSKITDCSSKVIKLDSAGKDALKNGVVPCYYVSTESVRDNNRSAVQGSRIAVSFGRVHSYARFVVLK